MLASSVPQQPVANTEKQNDLAPPQTVAQVNPKVHQVTQAAVKFGVLSSLKRIDQVATFLTTNNSSGVFVQKPKVPSDEHVLSTSFELIRPDNATIYATASFFPNNDAVYDTIEYVEMTCERAEKEIFKDLKRIGVLKKEHRHAGWWCHESITHACRKWVCCNKERSSIEISIFVCKNKNENKRLQSVSYYVHDSIGYHWANRVCSGSNRL
jgi:hypothetical protein